MTLTDFFMSSHGRISRQEYWLGMLTLVALTIAGAIFLDPDAMSANSVKVRPPTVAVTLWSLAFAWPSTVISVKRFNDRDWPPWPGYVLGAVMAAFVVANHLGYLLDPDTMSPAEKVITSVTAVGFLWALAENGFLRGTAGPNRYGADPLDRMGRFTDG